MPFLELLAPPLPEPDRARAAADVTAALCEALKVEPGIVTLYFLDIASDRHAHAGAMGIGGPQRIFAKLHAFRRGEAARRRAAALLTAALAAHYAVPAAAIAVYFLDRAPDEVAHGGFLVSDGVKA